MTYREISYYILDSIKSQSDDSSVTIEHIIFLLNKFRVFLIDLKYSKDKKKISDSNTYTICIDLELYTSGVCGSEVYLRSTEKIPDIISSSTPTIYLLDLFKNNISYVTPLRFRYVGIDKYTKNIIYCTIDSDKYLYLKSANSQFKYLKKVMVSAVFEDPTKAMELSCESNETQECTDVLDTSFCLEEALIPQLIELVSKELLGVTYRPKDTTNNSLDDIADIVSYVRRNMKSNLAKQMTS